MVRSFVTGAVLAAVAMLVTGVYLAAITIDTGFESLVFIPILVVLITAAAARTGWRRAPVDSAMAIGAGAIAATFAAMEGLAIVRREATIAYAAFGASLFIAVFVTLACLGSWALAGAISRRRINAMAGSGPDP